MTQPAVRTLVSGLASGLVAALLAAGLLLFLRSGPEAPVLPDGPWRELKVTVTAYTSTPGQTVGDPFEGAWSNRLTPGERAVAVSRDLLALGLDNGDRVWLEGFDKPFTVKDKMHARYEKRVDIYMGLETDKAREFGKQRRTLRWLEAEEEG